jgi:ligand-binding SRPBCC domain-containing protein
LKLFRFTQTQTLPATLEEAWSFFSDPRNLAGITPPELKLVPTSTVPDCMYPGMIITYEVKVLPALRVLWVTEITNVDRPVLFVDEQRFGPYRFWHHLHRFTAVEEGVRADDLIHYALHGGPLAAALDRLLVRPRLDYIFAFRRQALERRFGESPKDAQR